MKSIKQILAIAMVMAMMVGCFAISASAAAYEGTLYWNDNGLVVTCTKLSDVEKVVYNDTELVLGTDYTVNQDDADTTLIQFTESFMKGNLSKDYKSMIVYYGSDATDYFEVDLKSSIQVDNLSGVQLLKKGDYTQNSSAKRVKTLLEWATEKGVFTATTESGVTAYKYGNKVIAYVEGQYIYPADNDIIDTTIQIETTYEDLYFWYKQENTAEGAGNDFYDYFECVALTCGNRVTIDWSSFEAGTPTELDIDAVSTTYVMEVVPILCLAGKLTSSSNDFLTDFFSGTLIEFYSADGTKHLFDAQLCTAEEYSFTVTVYEGLTVEDNVYYDYMGDDDGDGGTVLFSLVFANPEIKSGDKQTWTKDKKSGLTIVSTAGFDDFIRIYVDGEDVDEDNYTVVKGSTAVTLKEAYLATLSLGTHTLDIVSKTGTATATFTIAEAEEVEEEEKIADTADNSAIATFVALGTLAAAGFVTLKKKEN